MSKLLPILLLFGKILSSQSQCEPCDITPNGWAIRPGTGCTEYINCVAGEEAAVNTCQGGTIFDKAIIGCNWDTIVTCAPDPECETTTTTTTTTELTTTTAAEEEEEDDDGASAMERDYVPLKFTVFGLPEDADEDDVKREMAGILEWILFEVEELEKDSGLKILDITAWGRRELYSVERGAVDTLRGMRNLQMRAPIDQMFNVAVKALEGVTFGPVIVDAIRKDLDSLIADVRGWSQYEYVTTDFGFDVCAYSEIGMDYNDCASGAAVTDSALTSSSGGASYEYGGGSSYKTEPETINSSDPLSASVSSEEGLPTVIIVTISLVSVLLFFCIVAIILFVGCRKDESDFIDDYSEDDILYGKRERGYSDGDLSRSTAENSTGQQLTKLENHDHSEQHPERPVYVDEEDQNSGILPVASSDPIPIPMLGESFRTINSSSSQRSHNSNRSHASHRSHRSQGSRRSSGHYSRPKRHQPDPSVFNIREDAEDPSVLSQTRRADPSDYQEQRFRQDPSVYEDHLRAADPDDLSSQFSRRFQHELNSLEGGSKKRSVKMDYSVVSELSEPSIADHFS